MAFPRPTDVDGTWQYISQGVDVIMVRDLGEGGLTPEVYMNMYTAIHNFCVATHPTQPQQLQHSHQQPPAARGHHTKLLGGELYARLKLYLSNHLQRLLEDPVASQVSGRELILYYNSCWTRYTTGAKYLDHIFSYLNRHWVKQERDEGGRQRGVYEVNTLCLWLWKDNFFMLLRARLVTALLDEIERHRNGEVVPVAEIQRAVQSLVSIGLDDQNTKRVNLLFYTNQFETEFIAATDRYYFLESRRFLETNGVVAYMHRVAQRLAEEHERVAMYLHPSTEELLIKHVENLLIANHREALQSEFLGLLDANRVEECHILYSLLGKVDSLGPVQETLQAYVSRVGNAAVERLLAETGGSVEPRAYIQTLLSAHQRFANLVTTAFESSPVMAAAVDRGCGAFINHNEVTVNQQGTPEMLAKFCDQLLRKSSRSAQPDMVEVEAALDGVIILLRFVDEKDAFEKHYSRTLSRRLVNQVSANHDLETSMVSKLGGLLGFEYTNKLQRMFQDMATSAELQQHFRQDYTAAKDFSPFVLAEGFWPLPERKVDFELPAQLQSQISKFQEFYGELHSSRRLKWLWNFGKGELKMNFTSSTHILQVSVYQIAILLAFSELDTDSLTTQSLLDRTKLPLAIFSGSVSPIVKAGVLIEDGNNLTINREFKSRRVRINLNQPLKIEVSADAADAERQLNEDRRLYLQAVMVRIMKARRELNHAQLVQETMQQAAKRFQPSIRDIKRCITVLVEKDYIIRIGTDAYEYVA